MDFEMKALLGTIGAVVLILGGLLWLAISSSAEYERECALRGGHVISRAAYKSSVSFCVSDDGRILD